MVKAAGMLLHQRRQNLSFSIVVEPQGKVNKQTVQPTEINFPLKASPGG